jgi:2-aminoadipate transaminase
MKEQFPAGCDLERAGRRHVHLGAAAAGLDSFKLLDQAIAQNVAFVPGGPFYANEPQLNTLRLSFVTVPPEKIRRGVAILGKILRDAIAGGLRASA